MSPRRPALLAGLALAPSLWSGAAAQGTGRADLQALGTAYALSRPRSS